MAIVWPCPLSVDAYATAGRSVEVPETPCPTCRRVLAPWSGYWRFVREAGRCLRVFVRRGRCAPCRVTHALLPAFALPHRLDVAETVGAVLDAVVGGLGGVRPAAAAAGIPHTTARGSVRAFLARAGDLAVRFAALAVELGGEVVVPLSGAGADALAVSDHGNSRKMITEFRD
ncbi:MAG TPA: DUF6431 domain-containing protein [Acidimicrobiales bacterium]|nr:DUF6431 domain-containing protein [Acidimicrobiales bacterium]